MVRCLAYDFGVRNITVNCIAPGGIKTDMYGRFIIIDCLLIIILFLKTADAAAKYIPGGDKMSEEQIDQIVGKWSPLGRTGYLDDTSGIIALLASPESQWITGQTLQVSGGAHMT
jgi:tetrahydroxynaphthalene reductase